MTESRSSNSQSARMGPHKLDGATKWNLSLSGTTLGAVVYAIISMREDMAALQVKTEALMVNQSMSTVVSSTRLDAVEQRIARLERALEYRQALEQAPAQAQE